MFKKLFMMAALLGAVGLAQAAAGPQALAESYARQAGAGATPLSPVRGEALYRGEHLTAEGKSVSCAGCHTPDPRQPGKTRAGKLIEPLAPTAHPARFTDQAKVEKWFRRNCQDVLGRECTAQEKGDFIAWLAGLAPARP